MIGGEGKGKEGKPSSKAKEGVWFALLNPYLSFEKKREASINTRKYLSGEREKEMGTFGTGQASKSLSVEPRLGGFWIDF